MTKYVLTLTLVLFSVVSGPAQAQAETRALANCFVDSLNGKERKDLAKWIYFSVAAHPEMQPYANISSQERAVSDKKVGVLVTRLLVDDCANELVEAQKSDPLAVELAFEMVGKVAMGELMNSQEVTTAITNYVLYTDQSALSELFAK